MIKLTVLVKKDLADGLRNWEVLYPLIGVCVASVFVILQMLYRKAGAPLLFPTHFAGLYARLDLLYRAYGLSDLPPERAFALLQFNTVYFFVIVAVALVLPSVFSATSVTTEREQGTLEVLLSLPFSNKEIISAKLCASVLPSLFCVTFVYLFSVLAVILRFDRDTAMYLMTAKWWLLHFIIVPVYALWAASSGLCISTVMRSSRAAVFASGFLLLPISLFILLPLMYGSLLFTLPFAIVSLIAGCFLFFSAVFLARLLFNREKMLLRLR